jgi:hypothetical protein
MQQTTDTTQHMTEISNTTENIQAEYIYIYIQE